MPLFEFECQVCGKVFEVRVTAARPTPVACPACQSTRLERLWSPFSSPASSSGGCGSPTSGFG